MRCNYSSLVYRAELSLRDRDIIIRELNRESDLKTYFRDSARKSKKKSWKAYRKRVWVITNGQDLKSLPMYERRGWTDYHIDHKISIWYGWKNNLPPKVIGHISNLRMLYYKDNLIKGIKSVFP